MASNIFSLSKRNYLPKFKLLLRLCCKMCKLIGIKVDQKPRLIKKTSHFLLLIAQHVYIWFFPYLLKRVHIFYLFPVLSPLRIKKKSNLMITSTAVWKCVERGSCWGHPHAPGHPLPHQPSRTHSSLRNNYFPPAAEKATHTNPWPLQHTHGSKKNTSVIVFFLSFFFYFKMLQSCCSTLRPLYSIETELSVASHHMPLHMRNWNAVYNFILKINQFFMMWRQAGQPTFNIPQIKMRKDLRKESFKTESKRERRERKKGRKQVLRSLDVFVEFSHRLWYRTLFIPLPMSAKALRTTQSS